jgi:dTDP-4-amino-4,6-dideoxygalactose transaminase
MDPSIGFRAEAEVQAFEDMCMQHLGGQYAIAVNGGGTALDLVLRAMNLTAEDEVVSCALNFAGTHLAVVGCGARLVLCEPDPYTLNISPADVERVITPKTRAIIATHMNGLSADIDALCSIARQHPHPRHGPLRVICDAARACGALYKGRPVSSGPWATVYSFQSKKIITTLGEGGVVLTDDDSLAAALRQYRSFGCNVNWGSNYKLSKLQAAVGLVQFNRLASLISQTAE